MDSPTLIQLAGAALLGTSVATTFFGIGLAIGARLQIELDKKSCERCRSIKAVPAKKLEGKAEAELTE